MLVFLACFIAYTTSSSVSWPAFSSADLFPVALVFALVPLNLLAEAKKLHFKLQPTFSLQACLAMVCKGFALDLFMPLGSGTYLGRAWMQKGGSRAGILELTAIGSLAQNLCNLFFGLLLILCMLPPGLDLLSGETILPAVISLLLGFAILLAWLLFRKSGVPDSWKKWLKTGNCLTIREVLEICKYAALRYSLYLLQYVLLLSLFPEVGGWTAAVWAGTYLMLASLIPLPGFLSVYGRMAISVWVFHLAGLSATEALTVSGFIFLLNALFPAMFGFYLLLHESIRQVKC